MIQLWFPKGTSSWLVGTGRSKPWRSLKKFELFFSVDKKEPWYVFKELNLVHGTFSRGEGVIRNLPDRVWTSYSQLVRAPSAIYYDRLNVVLADGHIQG